MDDGHGYHSHRYVNYIMPTTHHQLVHCSLIHWIIDSLMHRFIDSSTHIHPLIRCVICSLIHWFIDTVIHSFSNSLNHRFIDRCNDSLDHWFTESLIHRLTNSLLILHWFHNWFIRSIVHGYVHVISLVSQPPFAYSLMHLTASAIHCVCITGMIRSSCPSIVGKGRRLPGRCSPHFELSPLLFFLIMVNYTVSNLQKILDG